MNLVVFDLDGTLARTFAIDEHCFLQAFADALGIEEINRNWSDYEHVTDSGVVGQVVRDRFARDPTPSEVSKFVHCFVGLLEKHHAEAKDAFGETPGATRLLEVLRQQSNWGVAIATGSFEASARFKMKAAGLDVAGLPSAFAEDGPPRESIVQAAIARAGAHYQQSQFDRIVSVGDAVWDVQTAMRLGLPFVGVAIGARADQLRTLGTSHLVMDFRNDKHCLRCLEEATVPG